MPSVRKQHEDGARQPADHRRHHHQQRLLAGLERWVEAVDCVGVQQRNHGKHEDGDERVRKVPEPELVLGQVLLPRLRVREGPEAVLGDDPVVDPAVAANVAVGEAGEAAREAAKGEEGAAQVPKMYIFFKFII